MANPEHLAILKQGVEVWNEWREENPKIGPDLSGADLKNTIQISANFSSVNLAEANLTSAILTDTDFAWANLYRANLFDAKLYNAEMYEAQLVEVNISGANLFGANLAGTGLEHANLSGTDLSVVDLTGAYLTDADLSNARLSDTTFLNVDLSKTRGLDTVVHGLPSTIGIDTIYKSKGKIPESFLRGCGVPEDLIKFIPSITNQPFDYYSCFISYSSKDKVFARKLHADSETAGIRVWFAREDMKIGDRIRDRLDQSIRLYDKLLLILTEDSIESDWVEKEVETAFEKERRNPGKTVLFPIRLDDAVMDTDKAWAADIRRTRHIGDFTKWQDHDAYQKNFDRLLRDLKASEE